MLTTEEKRFIKYWEEQREGGKTKYLLLYIPVGTFICASILSVFYGFVISQMWSLDLGVGVTWLISLVFIIYLTNRVWAKNEKKFKAIIKREIMEGQMKDDKLSDEKLV